MMRFSKAATLWTMALVALGMTVPAVGAGAAVAAVTGKEATMTEAVSWDVDGIPVRGTLEWKAGEWKAGNGKRPAVVFVAGSGPTDRDWNSPLIPGTNGSAKLLAAKLADLGLVTLRYDKRSSGPDLATNAPRMAGKVGMKSFADELAGAYEVLRKHPDVDPSKIIVLANSEGVIHSLNFQNRPGGPRFAGLILTGAPGRPLHEVLKEQLGAQLKGLPDGAAIVRRVNQAIDAAREDREPPTLAGVPQAVRDLLASLSSPASKPFSIEFLNVDPAALLATVKEPVLVIIGKKDIQVDWKDNGRPLEAAVKSAKTVTFAYPENANHLLKYQDGNVRLISPVEIMNMYNSDKAHIDDEAWQTITTWLGQHGWLTAQNK